MRCEPSVKPVEHKTHDQPTLAVRHHDDFLQRVVLQRLTERDRRNAHVFGLVAEGALDQALEQVADDAVAAVMDARDGPFESRGEHVTGILQHVMRRANAVEKDPFLVLDAYVLVARLDYQSAPPNRGKHSQKRVRDRKTRSEHPAWKCKGHDGKRKKHGEF